MANKNNNLMIRISEQDKNDLKELAENKSMTVSELVLYLIRKEIDKFKGED